MNIEDETNVNVRRHQNQILEPLILKFIERTKNVNNFSSYTERGYNRAASASIFANKDIIELTTIEFSHFKLGDFKFREKKI